MEVDFLYTLSSDLAETCFAIAVMSCTSDATALHDDHSETFTKITLRALSGGGGFGTKGAPGPELLDMGKHNNTRLPLPRGEGAPPT